MKFKIGHIELNVRCILFGHTINQETDSGFHYCTRCDAHELYSYEAMQDGEVDAWAISIPTQIRAFISRVKRLFTIDRCYSCGKIQRISGFKINQHNGCLPF